MGRTYGSITIVDTTDIEQVYMVYAGSSSNTQAPDKTNFSLWKTDITQVTGDYIWQRTVIKKSGINIDSSNFQNYYGEPVCVTGPEGTAARRIISVVPYYYLSTSSSNQTGGSWSTSPAAYPASGTYYYWTKTITTYDSGNPTESSPVLDRALNSANETARSANATATAANQTANQANQTANSANQSATNAYNIATGINQHFWSIESDYATGLPAGSYITDTAIDTFKSNKTGGNLLTRSDGIWIRNGIQTLASLTGSALQFYNPSDNNHPLQLSIGANGTLQSGNYTRGSDSKFSSNGTKIDLINGDIITKYFRISQGLETGLNAGAYIHGTVEALDGRIGSDSTNYWEISQFTDYNLSSNATIVGHGGSFIQLGDSSTWRLATNRIHTGWYTSGDTVLHYPDINSKYWDFGIHAPTTTTEKFLYIRSSKNNTSTSNILQNLLYDIDDTYATSQWNYKFYIDANGNVHSPSYYIINSDGTEQTLSGSGLVASSLSCGTVGSLTQPIYFNNGVPATTTYALNAAGAKGVVTDIANNASSTNLPTTAAVVSYVTSRGYITTDNKVLTELASNNTTFYIAGPINTATTTGTLKVITDAKITVNSSGKATITATTFSGSLSGTASRATADSDGNTIKTTYLKLSGGNVTGPVMFGSSVSTDELTTGDLVVNGAASFTNNLQANTINGVAVGSSPKFTDTVTTVTVTGNGNAITAASASNGVVTLTKGTTFLTSYTETDPIFVASAAHGITSTDISNWNSKTSNTGTVTSVRVQASSPLTSTTNTASSTTLDTTIKFANQNKNLVLAGPSSGNAAAPTFRSLVAADIPNLSWNKITSDKPTTLSGYGITDAAGSNAIVGLSASSNSAGVTTFTATRASGTNPLSFEVSIVASAATGANALKDSNGLISKGSEIIPVYFSNGVPAEANTYAGGTAVTLNGSGKGASTASFYAPTTAGTTSQVLIGGGNAPTWTDISNLVPSSATSATYATYDASESSNTTKTTIANKYVKKSGDTMTNILTLYREGTTANNYPAGIKFSVKDTTTGQTYSNAYIFAYQDHGSTTYGTNMVIHSGGGMFIGSGESPANHYSAKGASYTGEEIYITSDGGVYIQSNGNTIANRVGLYINASHEIVPIKADVLTNNIGSIGTSTYKWANMYATTFHGALDGNATTATSATKDGSGNTITSTYVKKTGDTMSADLNFQGSTNDSPDIVWKYSDGTEKMRIWTANEFTAKAGPYFREYKADGTQLYSGNLVLGDGTGASGTWGISISGNAATATSATKATNDGDNNVITSTYVKKAGDSMSGGLAINASGSYSSYNEGLRINAGTNTFATLVMGGANNSTSGISDGAFWIGVYNTGTYTRRLMIAHNSSTSTNTYFYSNAAGTISPWLHLGNSGTITSGNADAVTGGVVYTAINNLSGTYVKTTGNEGILGTKVFGSGTSYGTVTNNTTYTQKANINYNSTLEAIVFSFA